MNLEERLSNCFKGNLKPLEHLIQTTLEKALPYDFFDHLCNSVVPFIKSSKELDELQVVWNKAESDHKHRVNEIEKIAIKEVKKTFKALTALIDSFKELSKKKELKKVKKMLTEIAGLLEHQDAYMLPPYYEVASDKLCDLCSLLIDQGYEYLLEGIVDVEYIDHHQVKESQTVNIKKATFVSSNFTNAVSARKKELSILHWRHSGNAWVIWKYLRLAEQCWHLDHSYFEVPAKALKGRNYQVSLSDIRAYWVEMQAIKKMDPTILIQFFKPERFREYLKTFISAIIIHQEKCLKNGIVSTKTLPCLHALQLKLNNNLLILDVEWYEGGTVTSYLLRNFHEESRPYLFFKTLLDNPKKPVELSDVDIHSSSVSKLIERANLTGPLKKLFFQSSRTKVATLKSNRILLSEQFQSPFEVRQYIESLQLEVIR